MQEGRLFIESLQRQNRMMAKGVVRTVEAQPDLSAWLLDPLARWTVAAYGDEAIDKAIDGYIRYCLHVSQAQQAYEREGRYPQQAIADVVAGVYEDEGYMVPYMWAAVLIYPFWPSMVRHLGLLRRYYQGLPPAAHLLELASGHGVLGLLAAETRPDLQVEGYDISPPADRVRFSVRNALDGAGEPGRFQAVLAAMLVEHLPNPELLFAGVKHHLGPGGVAYVSTALESAQKDHVTEFHRESELVILAETVGLRVTDLICDGQRTPTQGRFRPRALAMLVEHAGGV
jgi:2-polyprenyl-3-methyl-5-hydroxy-6-metoxy-1,4-benzoquinol methylase